MQFSLLNYEVFVGLFLVYSPKCLECKAVKNVDIFILYGTFLEFLESFVGRRVVIVPHFGTS